MQLIDLQEAVNFINESFKNTTGWARKRSGDKRTERKHQYSEQKVWWIRFCYRQEQYYCQNCLLLHGLEEESKENTDQRVTDALRESMGETISIKDIDRTHRLPEKKPNEIKYSTVKFVRYNTRDLKVTYATITSQDESYEAQVTNFFIS